MKIIKILLALPLFIGIPIPIISVSFYNNEHSVVFTAIAFACAFIATAMVYGISDFRHEPKFIGNIDKITMPVINQNWMVFFISLIINLIVANLCGTL